MIWCSGVLKGYCNIVVCSENVIVSNLACLASALVLQSISIDVKVIVFSEHVAHRSMFQTQSVVSPSTSDNHTNMVMQDLQLSTRNLCHIHVSRAETKQDVDSHGGYF